MDDATRSQIVQRLTDLGPQVDDPAQVDAALAEILGDEDAAERSALVAAVRDGVPEAVRTQMGYMPTNRLLLVNRLRDAGLDPLLARWAVETLTLVVMGPHALGLPQTSSAVPAVALSPERLPALGDNIFGWFWEALTKYADFSGRARRKEYWSFTLVYAVIYIALEFASGFPQGFRRSGPPGLTIATVIVFAYSILTLLPSLGVAVRRLHDVDKSGWYMLWYLLPFVGWIVVLVALVAEGQRWANQYGPDPKGSSLPAASW